MQPTTHRTGTLVCPEESRALPAIQAYKPPPELEPFVEYFWVVRWDVATPQVTQTIPQPRIHLTIEGDRILVYGIDRQQFTRHLSGKGVVLGTAFRPAGFRAFTDIAINTLQDQVVPASTLFRAPPGHPPSHAPSDEDLVQFAIDLLTAQQPIVDPLAQWCEKLVQQADSDRSIVQVQQLAEIARTSERSLQRRFAEYVGISPKWVIQRSRIMNLVADCNARRAIDWASIANELGFSDQAHLIRTFRTIVGITPDAYLKRILGRESPQSINSPS